jgi:Tol biopolymer transport system component
MAIASGTRFGPYEITEPIGSGGMGEVYRAADTRLKRDVALKVLPESFADDADRLARFRREAEVLASLNHANIAQIYGLEQNADRTAIVMELVDGPTLAERIAAGPMPPDEALGIARQIGDALEAAHGRQVVHRDLKPANVKLKPDGTVKVLDFGIAKAVDAQAASGDRAPIVATPAVTETGVILGTAAYMSPEQARGKPVDQRTDIWAFGCLLFEMLTGQPAFGGEDVMLTLARVLDRDTDLSSMPGTISAAVRHTIKLCLEKDPVKRIADIRDVRLALEGTFETALPHAGGSAIGRPLWQRAAVVAVAVIVTAAVTLIAAANLQQPTPRRVARFAHPIPDDQRLNDPYPPAFDISPDGSEIVYAGGGGLIRRRLDELDGRMIQGTEGEQPTHPVYSPDGLSILYAFYSSRAGGPLKRVPVDGGIPQLVLPAAPDAGFNWNDDGMLYLGDVGVLSRVSSQGGEPEPLIRDEKLVFVDPARPAGRSFVLFQQLPAVGADSQVGVYSLATNEKTVLFPGQQPRYLEPGYLVYFDSALGLAARVFDPDTFEYGNPAALVSDVLRLPPDSDHGNGGVPQFRLSANGTLVYLQGRSETSVELDSTLASVADDGTIERLDVPARRYSGPQVSPDGSKLVIAIGDGTPQSAIVQGKAMDIFVYDLSGDSEMRQLTFGANSLTPAWSEDGEWITYASTRDGSMRIYRQRADGTGSAEALTQPAEGHFDLLPAWAPDGRLTYTDLTLDDRGAVEADVLAVSPTDGTPELLVGGDGIQGMVRFAPSGKAFAYFSGQLDEMAEVYVEHYPRDGSIVRVSQAGMPTTQPVWRRDGRQLYYSVTDPDTNETVVGAVEIDTDTFAIRDRRTLGLHVARDIGVIDSLPGGGLLAVLPEAAPGREPQAADKLIIVENWIDELETRLPLD